MSNQGSDDKNANNEKQRPENERRCDDLKEVFIDRRRIERRVIVEDIDFTDRRKKQRRSQVLGLDFKDRRKKTPKDDD